MKTQKEYIQDVLIGEIGDIVQRHAFLSFTLMASAIELLGNCIDNDGLFRRYTSEKRFRDAIDKLFPAEYKKYNSKNSTHDLYTELRCGVNHMTTPNPKIGFSERKNGATNLSINPESRLVLVAEDFYDDFKLACEKVIQMLDDGLIQPKFNLGPF